METPEGFLEGIRIVDLAGEEAAFSSKLLADLGATVIKVEQPGGDPSRRAELYCHEGYSLTESPTFLYNNSNKLGITLDIEKSQGREIFLKLIEKTDVVIETFPPGYLDRLGLGYEILKKAKSDIIMVSVTPFGQDGPRTSYKGCDLVACAFSGQMSVTGSATGEPLKPAGQPSYFVASLYAAISILLALRKRSRTGEGARLAISVHETGVSTLDDVMVRYFFEGVIPARQGSLSRNRSSFVLRSKDGFIYLSLFPSWRTLVEWIDSEGMAQDLTDEKYEDEKYRYEHIDHIIEVIQRWTASHTSEELFKLGQALQFPWAPVYAPQHVIASPQLRARGFFTDVQHPELGAGIDYPGMPFCIDRKPRVAGKRAPTPGEDNLKVYRDMLGLSEREIERLSSTNVI